MEINKDRRDGRRREMEGRKVRKEGIEEGYMRKRRRMRMTGKGRKGQK